MNQFEQNMQDLLNELQILVADALLELSLDGKALIQRRIQEEGLNASGGKTSDYSERYKLYRVKKGRQVNYMDATLTGEMWRSTGMVEQSNNAPNIKVSIAGRDEFTQLKIDNISKHHFELLKLSKEEEVLLADVFNENLGNKAVNILGRGL